MRTSFDAANPRYEPDSTEMRGGDTRLERAEALKRAVDFDDSFETIAKRSRASSKVFPTLAELADIVDETLAVERRTLARETDEAGIRVVQWPRNGFLVARPEAITIGSRVARFTDEAKATAHAVKSRAEELDVVEGRGLASENIIAVDGMLLALLREPPRDRVARFSRVALVVISVNAQELARALVREFVCPDMRLPVQTFDGAARIMKLFTTYFLARTCAVIEEMGDPTHMLSKSDRKEETNTLRVELLSWTLKLVEGGAP